MAGASTSLVSPWHVFASYGDSYPPELRGGCAPLSGVRLGRTSRS